MTPVGGACGKRHRHVYCTSSKRNCGTLSRNTCPECEPEVNDHENEQHPNEQHQHSDGFVN